MAGYGFSRTDLSFTIYDLMEIAEREMRERIPEEWYTDDWMWCDTAFQFVIWKGRDSYGRDIITDPYRFCYDEDEALWGTAEEQLMGWLDRWFYVD